MESATLKKIFNVTSTVIVIIVVLIALFLMGARIIGLNVYNVISGSMEPTYSVGDLIYVKGVDYEKVSEEIKVGDPITFVLNSDKVVATHRVVKIDVKNQMLYTKGDTNGVVDPPVLFKNVIGKPIFSIPFLGYVSAFMQTPIGMVVTITVGLLLILLVFLPDIVGLNKKKTASKEAEAFFDEKNSDGDDHITDSETTEVNKDE